MRLLAIILAAVWLVGVTLFMPGNAKQQGRPVSVQLSTTTNMPVDVH
jgi:hypothetical protein